MNDRVLKESDVVREVESLLVSNEMRHLNDLEYGNNQALYHVIDRIEDLPSADRPQGEWIDKGWKGDWQFETDGRGNCWHDYECSACGFHNKGSKSNFCPNCGARMKGTNDELV